MPKNDCARRNICPRELCTAVYFRDICSSISSLLMDSPSLKTEFVTPILHWVTNHAHCTLCHAYIFLDCECPTIWEKSYIEK